MARQRESKLSGKIIEYLESVGFKAWKNAGSAYQEYGRPDVMAIKPYNHRAAYFLAIETKTPVGDAPTDLQQRWLNDADKHGGIAFCARSVDEVRSVLKNVGVLE